MRKPLLRSRAFAKPGLLLIIRRFLSLARLFQFGLVLDPEIMYVLNGLRAVSRVVVAMDNFFPHVSGSTKVVPGGNISHVLILRAHQNGSIIGAVPRLKSSVFRRSLVRSLMRGEPKKPERV